MKSKLEQILDRYLGDREIAVWGSPTRRLLRELQPWRFHEAGQVDVRKHYILAVTEEDLDDFLSDGQSGPFRYAEDYTCFSDAGGQLPFEWDCHGAKIGRQTYFGDGLAGSCADGYIKSIGHFTSINGTADMANDHQQNMCFVSDDISDFFSEENKAKFKRKYLADPKRPYDANQRLLTIGSDVWIGAYAFINCSKVTSIGHGAIIGAGAVVNENVPPYAIAAGVPAKIKRYRYPPEMVELLLRVKWWEWSAEEIDANADALMSPELFYERFK